MLVWQSCPSCSYNVPYFGEAMFWCSIACKGAKVFLGGLCYDRISKRYLGSTFERGCFEREFIRSEWKLFILHSIFSIPSWGNGLPLLLGSMYALHPRSLFKKAWARARQGAARTCSPSLRRVFLAILIAWCKQMPPPYRLSLPSSFACQV